VLECPEDANNDDQDAQHANPDRVEEGWPKRGLIEWTQALLKLFSVEFVSVDHAESTQRPHAVGEAGKKWFQRTRGRLIAEKRIAVNDPYVWTVQ
jgi:hypothetical protein